MWSAERSKVSSQNRSAGGIRTGESAAACRVDCEHTLSLELVERDVVAVQIFHDRIGQGADLGVDGNADQENGE